MSSARSLIGGAQCLDYPDVLRRPTHEVPDRCRAGGTSLIRI